MIAEPHHSVTFGKRIAGQVRMHFGDEIDFTADSSESLTDDMMESDLENTDESEQQLNQVARMMLSSLSSYQEIADLASEPHLRTFAEVMIRQRGAQCRELLQHTSHWIDVPGTSSKELSEIRSLWRLAIWNYEQHESAAFIEYSERAEALLEESYLKAAGELGSDAISRKLNEFAITVCGARNIWEEMGDEVAHAQFLEGWADTDIVSHQHTDNHHSHAPRLSK